MKAASVLAVIIPSLALSGCFTGVESTPKIKASEAEKVEKEIGGKAESEFLSGVAPLPPSEWDGQTRFYVSDDKISLIFTSTSTRTDSLAGHTLSFRGFAPTASVTGEDATEVTFISDRGDLLHYVISATPDEILRRNRLDIPFTVEMTPVAKADSLMRGHTYYVTTAIWYDDTGRAVNRLRHVPVTVVSVTAGNHNHPLLVNFHEQGSETVYSVFMTIGNDRMATRNFETLFAFDNPRSKYPQIADDMWEKIIHSQLADGMTRDEARLALGAPNEITRVPTNAAMIERWSYDDGIYLIFEDGILTRFRK